MNDKEELRKSITEFISVILKCNRETSFANDRLPYLIDLALACEWLVELEEGIEIPKIVEKITSPQSDKVIGDYFKGGDWGVIELEAFGVLRNKSQKLS